MLMSTRNFQHIYKFNISDQNFKNTHKKTSINTLKTLIFYFSENSLKYINLDIFKLDLE